MADPEKIEKPADQKPAVEKKPAKPAKGAKEKKWDKFDPYREALVRETATVWPEGLADAAAADRAGLERQLHEAAEQVGQLEYVRLPTGFCRRITVTREDLDRLG